MFFITWFDPIGWCHQTTRHIETEERAIAQGESVVREFAKRGVSADDITVRVWRGPKSGDPEDISTLLHKVGWSV